MPFTVGKLIEGRQKPIVTTADQPLQEALTRMLEHGYSQLPVVDADGKPIAMITSDSVVRALNNLRVKTSDLRVYDALTKKPHEYRPEDEIFDVLDALRDSSAVLIVDGKRELVGIVTSWDTMEYFRQRAQDTMYVQEIEDALKNYINAAFTQPSGDIDEDKRTAAIDEITPSNQDLRGPFQQALVAYLQLQGDPQPKPHGQSVSDAFKKHLYRKQNPKPWEKLTLYEYIELFLHSSRWSAYQPIFRLDHKSIREMLTSVLHTRNDLAHFRTEISTKQRDELWFCKDWLLRHEPAVAKAFLVQPIPPAAVPSPAESDVQEAQPEVQFNDADAQATPEEAVSSNDSRYAPLAIYLQSINRREPRVEFTFGDIERIIGDELPPSARRMRAWWANDAQSHVQSQEWLNVGWRVATINMGEERVTFARIEERQRAYIDFFSPLLTMLREANAFPIWNTTPDGASWLGIATLRKGGTSIAGFNFAFTRTRQFRIELYIDSGDQGQNKQLFDALNGRKEQIEQELGASLSWERLPEKRASRIAVYHDVFITADEADLAALRVWAVEMMIRFHDVMQRHVIDLQPGAFAAPQP